jgi:CheY-like chemotaxis protein
MLRQALILSLNREYAQTMRHGVMGLGDKVLVNIEIDPLRAMQMSPQQYDLILLDAALDELDGLQLLQFIKNQAPATKFIVVSDTSDESSRAVAYQAGADYFLDRPTTPDAYGHAVKAISALFQPTGTKTLLAEDRDEPPVNLADIVQIHCLSGDSVLLVVRAAAQTGDIFIFRGEIYHAQYPGRSGERAFRDMLRWDDGQVRIKPIKLTQAPPRTIEIHYQELLNNAGRAEPEPVETERPGGDLLAVASGTSPDTSSLNAIREAPPRTDPPRIFFPDPTLAPRGTTPLPQMNAHWRVALTGELLEGSQVAEPDRCAFITTFFFRKLADVAVALEVDYFNTFTLYGPHQQQVLVADNLGIRHGVFDLPWTNEAQREQYIKWCREQSL